MPHTDKQTAKIIRFYSNVTGTQSDKSMDTLAIDDLTTEGFVPFRFRGKKDPKTELFETLKYDKWLVHHSVPLAESTAATKSEEWDHPIIQYEIGYGWEAKWGAIRFPLRHEVELWRFMRLFDYPISIDTK